MKKYILSFLSFCIGLSLTAQTTIDFDTIANWIPGSAGIGSYAVDHSYVQGDFSSVAWPALRNGNAVQGSTPGALGTYSWRIKNTDTAQWVCTIATGGVSTFSLEARAWDNSPSPDFTLESSVDAGATWDSITVVNNTTLSNTDAWKTYSGAINSNNNDILIRLRANGPTERIMIDNFSWFAFGAGGTIDTLATITTIDASVLENVGTVDVTVTLNQTPVLDKTVDLVLNIGNNAVVNGFTPQTITFTGGSTSQTVTITVTPGQLSAASETLEFGLANAGAGLMYGADTLFNLTVNELPPAITPCSDLYFSEYIEGNSNNKALEIYNPTTGIIDLSNYELRKYTNASATVSSTISLSGLLLPGNVYVIANPNAFQVFLDQADMTSGIISHNGNDAYDLFNISAGTIIDQIGDNLGVNPTSGSWPVGTGTTANFTLVRMATVNAGTSTWFGIGDQQWDVYPVDDSTHIGSHTNTSCNDPIPLTAFPMASSMEVCLGETITFTHNSFGGTSPINAAWEINAVQTITDTLEYVANTSGLITISFGVMDGTMATDDSVFTILVNALPVNGLTFDNNTVCAMDTANFTSSATGASSILTYAYSVSPSGVLLDSANGSGNGYIVPDTDGTFTLTQMVTDSLGCMSSSMYTVVSNVLDDATFGALSNVCSTDTVHLQNTNTSGTWSGSIVTDQTGGIGFAHGAAGIYDITYTTSGSCPDSHTESVEIYANPVASFTFTGNIAVSFNSTSIGGTDCVWDFGDGGSSALCAPTHTYATDGVYTVCLTSTNSNNCSDSICQTVTIQGVGIKENAKNNFTFYPNPSEGNITITTSNMSTVQIVNIVGNIVSTLNINGTRTLDLSDLSKGSYFIKVTTDGKTETKKLILQ